MPGSILAETTRTGKLLQFTEEDHRYVIKDKESGNEEKELISVTTLIGNYHPKFDADGSIARNVALKRGVTVESVKAEWASAGPYGTRVHEYMEDLIRGNKPRNEPQDERERIVFEQVAHFFKNTLKPNFETMTPEKIICDYDLGIAGTIDFLGKDPRADQLIMMDWKTNTRMDVTPFGGKEQWCYPPVDHIPDCNYGHYQLQLNLYEYILKHAGYISPTIPVVKYLVHFHKDTGTTMYKVPDRKKEVEAIIEDYLSKKQ